MSDRLSFRAVPHPVALRRLVAVKLIDMAEIIIDPESDLVQEHFATVYTPRRQRRRFPENCVQVYDSAAAARAAADADSDIHAAVVVGPSRSSEGFRLYYLVRWIE